MIKQTNKLSIKDLVTIGVFTAIFLVFYLLGGMPFAINPVLTFYMPLGCALVCGPIYLLLVAKVHKKYTITILAVLMACIVFMTGMHPAFSIGFLVMGIVAEIVAGSKNYQSKKMNSLSYILFTLASTGSYLVYFANPEAWAATMLQSGTEASYITTMNATASPMILVIMLVGTIVCATLSSLVGCKMLKKQFEKSGIIHD